MISATGFLGYVDLVDAAEDDYFKSLGRKLTDAKTGIKAYWQTGRQLIRNECILPLLEDDFFVPNFLTKAVRYYEHFIQQCSLIM